METPFDYFFDDRTNPRTIEAWRGGPLASPLEAYAQRLHEDAYATHSGFVQLRLLGRFSSSAGPAKRQWHTQNDGLPH
jgi:hypothetical protein